MNNYEKLASLSGGSWVSVDDAKAALGVERGFYTMLNNLRLSDRYVVSVREGVNRVPSAYRAIDTKDMSAIELAKLRKGMGFISAPECHLLGKGL